MQQEKERVREGVLIFPLIDFCRIVAAAFIAADVDVCNDGLEEVFGRRHG